AFASASGRRHLQAESVLLHAGILEELGQFDEAARAYESNLAGDLPVEQRRQALLKIIELAQRQNQAAGAAARLEKFLAQYPDDPAADAALLTLGELHLK